MLIFHSAEEHSARRHFVVSINLNNFLPSVILRSVILLCHSNYCNFDVVVLIVILPNVMAPTSSLPFFISIHLKQNRLDGATRKSLKIERRAF